MKNIEKKVIKSFKIYAEEIDEVFEVKMVEVDYRYQMIITGEKSDSQYVVRYDNEQELLKIFAEAIVMNYRFIDVINDLMEEAMELVEDDEEVL